MTVYSLSDDLCYQCRFTKRKMDDLNISYDVVRADADVETMESLKSEILGQPGGRLTMPVVKVDMGSGASWSWQGYRPSQIEQLAVRQVA